MLLFPSPGDLPDPGIKSRSSALQADFLPSEPPGKGSRLQVISTNLVLPRSHRRSDNYVNVEVVMNAHDMLRFLQQLSCEWFLMVYSQVCTAKSTVVLLRFVN